MLFSCKEDKGLYYLGSADKVTVTKDNTTIINGHGDREALNNHLKLLKYQMINEGVEINKLKLKERLAKLQGGAAIIHVGGISEVEMLEKKDRIDDALNATRAALEEGVVIGGGYALLNSMEDVLNTDYETEDEKLGIDIILKAIQAPHHEIYKNAGITPEEITTGKNNTLGYNLRSNTTQDFFEVGVIDPAKVTRVACENAVSVAGMFLTTECVIINEIEEK
jgi:chaperonin GroEL